MKLYLATKEKRVSNGSDPFVTITCWHLPLSYIYDVAPLLPQQGVQHEMDSMRGFNNLTVLLHLSIWKQWLPIPALTKEPSYGGEHWATERTARKTVL
jgi:hypothetical protein